MSKSIEEINEKIRNGKAVILTAHEVKEIAKTSSAKEIARKVDVVTTATFGPMCSSGAFINFNQSTPPINLQQARLNDVNLCCGIAAADAYIGATELSLSKKNYGGANVICDLIKGKSLSLQAKGKVSDCYPKEAIETSIDKTKINEFYLYNPRNAYQNYGAATNSDIVAKHTYMGLLKPEFGNISFSTTGEISPLINDPFLKTIGIGTRIWVAGSQGYIAGAGTQNYVDTERNQYGIPIKNAASIAIRCDAKNMNPRFIQAVYFKNYGVSLYLGIGVAIPILTEDIAQNVLIKNSQIDTTIFDYGKADKPKIAKVNYEELFSGCVKLYGKNVKTKQLSSVKIATDITNLLKNQILNGRFLLTQYVENLSTVSTPLDGAK